MAKPNNPNPVFESFHNFLMLNVGRNLSHHQKWCKMTNPFHHFISEKTGKIRENNGRILRKDNTKRVHLIFTINLWRKMFQKNRRKNLFF